MDKLVGQGWRWSARVYLAKWARTVAEEGERARKREAHGLSPSEGSEERSDLGVFELLAETSNIPTPKPTRDPKHPIDAKLWDSWFDPATGQTLIPKEEMKKEVFRRGLKIDVKRRAWPFVLNTIPWDSTSTEREKLWQDKR